MHGMGDWQNMRHTDVLCITWLRRGTLYHEKPCLSVYLIETLTKIKSGLNTTVDIYIRYWPSNKFPIKKIYQPFKKMEVHTVLPKYTFVTLYTGHVKYESGTTQRQVLIVRGSPIVTSGPFNTVLFIYFLKSENWWLSWQAGWHMIDYYRVKGDLIIVQWVRRCW